MGGLNHNVVVAASQQNQLQHQVVMVSKNVPAGIHGTNVSLSANNQNQSIGQVHNSWNNNTASTPVTNNVLITSNGKTAAKSPKVEKNVSHQAIMNSVSAESNATICKQQLEPIESITQLKMKQALLGHGQDKVLAGITNVITPYVKSEIKVEAVDTSCAKRMALSTDDWRQQNTTHCGIVVPSTPNIPPLSPSPPMPAASTTTDMENIDDRPGSAQSAGTDESKETQQQVISSTEANIVDGINLEEIKNFARAFKMRRLSLGLTQTQVGQLLSATEGPSYSQSAICRFEKLDITPKSAQKIKPVLERWMKEMEEKWNASGVCDVVDLPDSAVDSNKKRKRRTSFAPSAINLLNNYFKGNTHPTSSQMNELAEQLGYDKEVVRVWFCNKRQTLKNNYKKQQLQLQQQLRNQGLLPVGQIEGSPTVMTDDTQDSDRCSTIHSCMSQEETIVPTL